MVAEHPDPLVRDQYVMTVASRCHFEPDIIRTMLRDGVRPVDRRDESRPRVRIEHERDSPELEVLRLAVAKGDEILRPAHTRPVHRPVVRPAVYDLLCSYDSLHEVIEHGGPEVAAFVQRLSVQESTADPVDVVGVALAGVSGAPDGRVSAGGPSRPGRGGPAVGEGLRVVPAAVRGTARAGPQGTNGRRLASVGCRGFGRRSSERAARRRNI